MSIPDYQTLFRPILDLAAQGQVSRQSATLAMAECFTLTLEERQRKIPSGSASYIRNRVGWAMTYLTKAGLIHKVAPKLYEATGHGQGFLSSHPDRFGNRELRDIGAFREFQKSKRAEDGGDSEPPVAELSTPYERIRRGPRRDKRGC